MALDAALPDLVIPGGELEGVSPIEGAARRRQYHICMISSASSVIGQLSEGRVTVVCRGVRLSVERTAFVVHSAEATLCGGTWSPRGSTHLNFG